MHRWHTVWKWKSMTTSWKMWKRLNKHLRRRSTSSTVLDRSYTGSCVMVSDMYSVCHTLIKWSWMENIWWCDVNPCSCTYRTSCGSHHALPFSPPSCKKTEEEAQVIYFCLCTCNMVRLMQSSLWVLLHHWLPLSHCLWKLTAQTLIQLGEATQTLRLQRCRWRTWK